MERFSPLCCELLKKDNNIESTVCLSLSLLTKADCLILISHLLPAQRKPFLFVNMTFGLKKKKSQYSRFRLVAQVMSWHTGPSQTGT